MASMRDGEREQSMATMDEDDIRGDGKKKKFKPLSAVRKFFGKKRRKEDSVVAVKAQSTTALHSDYNNDDEDEDDGGFTNHQKPLSLAGTRSISEDSVFSPEQRDTPISPFPKSAVSEESLPKSAFQSELLSKLNKRRSQYSDDDHDDGLPRSPVPPVTTADVIMGGPLKPGPSAKKSNNRDSDQSLISVDSSDNEEEDLFQSKWKSSVPAKKLTGHTSPKTSDSSQMESMDFDVVPQRTQLLSSSAAKDKISVKPKGRKATTNRQSRKKRDTSSPQSLPSLNEESPTRSQPEEVQAPTPAEAAVTRAQEKRTVVKVEERPPQTSRPPLSSIDNRGSQKTGGAVGGATSGASSGFGGSSSVRTNMSSIRVGTKPDKPSATTASTLSTSATATPTISAPPSEAVTTTVQNTRFGSQKFSGVSYSGPQSQSASSSSTNQTTPSVGLGSVQDTRIGENLSASARGQDKVSSTTFNTASPSRLAQSVRGNQEEKTPVDFKSRMSQFQTPSSTKVQTGNSASPANVDTPALKVTEPGANVTLSPKDDYKARRQGRSRTLPEATDEQSSPKVQRSSSHRIQTSTTLSSDQSEEMPTSGPQEKVSSESSSTGTDTSVQGVRKFTKFGSMDSSGEPGRLNVSWRRREEPPTVAETDKGTASSYDNVTLDVSKSGTNTSAPKSVSSSYLEKKRGSVETVAFKGKELSEFKKPEITASEAKRPSIDASLAKQPSVEVSSTKRESIEIDVSELSSVRALRNSFAPNRNDTSGSVRDNKSSAPSAISATSATDRAKFFSGSSSSSSSSSSAAATSASNTSSVRQERPPSPIYDNVKPSSSAAGISHLRGSSVKPSTTKTAEVKPVFPSRGGSVRTTSALSTTPASNLPPAASTAVTSSSSLSVLTKSNSESAGTTPAPSSSSSSSVHTSQPSTSLSSNTASVTSSSSSSSTIKPVLSVFPSKPPVTPASASKPSSNPTQPISKANPTPAASIGVKSVSGSIGVRTAPVSNVKPLASASTLASNVSSTADVVSTSSSVPSSTSSSTSSPSRSSSVRSHSSFTTSSAFKPQMSSNSPVMSSRTSSVTKSPSFKSTNPTPITATTTPAPTKTSVEEKKTEPPAKVPAWRANLGKKIEDVKIEIIENSPTTPSPSSSSSSSQPKSENLSKVAQTAKKTDSSSGTGTHIQTDKVSNRSSKVLDLVKNFQNFQVST